MAHHVDFSVGAIRQFRKLPESIRTRLAPHIQALAGNPRPAGSKKLMGAEGYRLRVDDNRILYEIHDDTSSVLIVQAGHRREVYRGH